MATTIKYDVTDVETGGGGEDVQPAMYAGKIVSVTHRTQKTNGDPANDLEVVVDVGENYKRLWTYVGLGVGWKMREFTDAVGLPPKGELTAAKLKALANTKVNVKVVADTDQNGDYRGKIKNLFKPGEGGVTTESNGDHEDGYETLDMDDLKAELAEREIAIPKGRVTEAKLIALLEADDEENGGGGGDDDAETETETAVTTDEYDEWELQDLKDELGEREIAVPKGRVNEAKLIALLREDDAAKGGGGGEDEAEPDEYDDEEVWPDQDLKDELSARNEQGAEIKITGRANRAKLIAALREDDANAEPF